MDIHKPKAAHSLEEFLRELVTVVAGILIALALEAVVEEIRIDRQISYAEDDFRAELQSNRDKVSQDIDDLQKAQPVMQKIIGEAQTAIKQNKLSEDNSDLRRGFIVLTSGAWTNGLSTQVLGHFPHAEARALAAAYSEQDALTYSEHIAEQQWFEVGAFSADNGTFTMAEVRPFLRQMIEADEYLDGQIMMERHILKTFDTTLKTLAR